MINTEATHSFISSSFAYALGLGAERLEPLTHVDTPVGGLVPLNRICRNCEFTIGDCRLVIDLILLDMSSFDVVLGMNWLSAHNAFIDCFRRRVTFLTLQRDCIRFVGDRLDLLTLSLRSLCERRSHVGLLASLVVEEGEIYRGEFPHIVVEYSDVFLEDLPGLLRTRDIEFIIDLVPGTAPISIALY